MEPHRQYGHRSETSRNWRSARILALVNFALADGYIAGFDAKYRFNFWRPITAIRMAALDGNARRTRILAGIRSARIRRFRTIRRRTRRWGRRLPRCLSRTSGIACLSPPRARAFRMSPDTIGDSRKPRSRTDCHASTAESTFSKRSGTAMTWAVPPEVSRKLPALRDK